MARSDYIYAVMNRAQPMPVVTFTVKHELRTFLSRQTPGFVAPLRVFRMDDGAEGVKAEMSVNEILEGK